MSTAVQPVLKAPFPWFGGKSRAAALIWERFGRVDNYVEPFAGSLAVLLGNPHPPKVETVNDKDALLANFWRAVKWAPDAVAEHCDWPVNEADLHARHRWLVERIPEVTAGMDDPEWFDARVAGWWVWGIGTWCRGGWCQPSGRGNLRRSRPHLWMPQGVHGFTCDARSLMHALSSRLRHARVCCGEWDRILSPMATTSWGVTGIMLDPPYSHQERDGKLYRIEMPLADAVATWAKEHGDNPLMRIALCGYSGEHGMPGWTSVKWEAHGGLAHTGRRDSRGHENAKRETIWFSPHCLEAKQLGLFPAEGR